MDGRHTHRTLAGMLSHPHLRIAPSFPPTLTLLPPVLTLFPSSLTHPLTHLAVCVRVSLYSWG